VKLDQFDRAPTPDVVAGRIFQVEVIEFSRELLLQLQTRPDDIFKLDADQFELLLCDRLQAMGMWVRRNGSVYEGDGGIDIVAGPQRYPIFPFLLAIQAKHHKNRLRKTGPSSVREFQSVVQNHPFQAGMLITNTSFTASAQWEAENRRHLVRLRDFEDLKRWIQGSFLHEAEWREIPESIEYAPGKRILIPKSSWE
jgi:restriction endonuclease Mrr